jgi:hypothetical protein
MTIYNFAGATVMLTIEEKTYKLAPYEKRVLKLPTGEYAISAYIAYSDGTPVLKKSYYRRHDGGNITHIYPATTANLWVESSAELNIRSWKQSLRGVSGYEQILLDFECQNCELSERRDGFVDASVPKALIRSCKIHIGFTWFLALLIMVIGVAFTVLLAGVIGESAPMTESVLMEIFPMLVAHFAAIYLIIREARNLHFIKICNSYPILNLSTESNEVIDNDDL